MSAPELTAEQVAEDTYWRQMFEPPEPDAPDRLPQLVLALLLLTLAGALVVLGMLLAGLG